LEGLGGGLVEHEVEEAEVVVDVCSLEVLQGFYGLHFADAA
jgi:hypothetical protein